MSYVVFARKYRPQTFDHVVAQEHVTRTLRNAVLHDRIASGYLFCGPRGTGKTTVARILAKAVNCANSPTDNPCGVCSQCLEIANGSSMDVLEIDAASNTGVDDIRTLRENIRYLPAGGKKRIYIIDEVHRLSGSAFDALLKTLEEPPPHVLFVFATTEPLKVPETILSRTQRFDFRRVSVEELAKHLQNIATNEKIDITEAALHLIARKADGSVRDSLSLMDQIVAFAGEKIDEPDVVQALGLIDREFLFSFVAAIAASNRKQALRLSSQVIENGIDVGDFAEELLEHFRILMILQSDPDASGALSLTDVELTQFRKQAEFFQIGDLLRFMNMVVDLNNALKSGLDERLLIEVAAIRMASMESTVSLTDLLEKLNSGTPLSMPTAPAASTNRSPELFTPPSSVKRAIAPPARPTPVSAASTSAPTMPSQQSWPNQPINLPQLQTGWDGFLTNFRQSFPMLASQLRMAEMQSVKENQILFMFYSAGEASRQLVQKADNVQTITNALRDYYKTNLSVRFEIDLSKEYPAGFVEQSTAKSVDPVKLVENSPRLKKLMDKVDGEIIGIKKVEQ